MHKQDDIHELPNCKDVKRKSILPATSLDNFLKKQGIYLGDETKHDNHTVDDVEFMHAPLIEEHNKEMDDLVDQEEISDDEHSIDEEIDIIGKNGMSKKKNVRGQTTCKEIHARNLEEREEVTFDKGQVVGPTNKIVSDLTNFIGTIARNPRFISLMYTSWHAVPDDTKKRIWEYVKSKFLISKEGKKWVMTCLRDAWRQYKQKIKKRCFDKNSTVEDMLSKRPDDIPEAQFRQLIEYWKHPTIQAMCEVNSQNRKKQKWRHRMGPPINFARVRMALRATKENNEEPSKAEMFITTRTKTEKEVQVDTQVAIAELQNRQNSRETADEAFRAVFGMEKLGRLRCYGRSVTATSLKKDEETNKLKQKHANEITSRKKEMNEMREEMQHLFSQLLQNNPGLNVQDIPGCVGSNLASPIDASSAQAVKRQNLPHSSGSTHASVLQKENVGDAGDIGGRNSI